MASFKIFIEVSKITSGGVTLTFNGIVKYSFLQVYSDLILLILNLLPIPVYSNLHNYSKLTYGEKNIFLSKQLSGTDKYDDPQRSSWLYSTLERMAKTFEYYLTLTNSNLSFSASFNDLIITSALQLFLLKPTYASVVPELLKFTEKT